MEVRYNYFVCTYKLGAMIIFYDVLLWYPWEIGVDLFT